MLAACDFVVAAAPSTPKREDMIGPAQIAALKSSAVVINIGRGPVIDEPALVAALESNKIRGAALDVFTVEPLPAGHAFYKLQNVLLSPHSADHTAGLAGSARSSASSTTLRASRKASLSKTWWINMPATESRRSKTLQRAAERIKSLAQRTPVMTSHAFEREIRRRRGFQVREHSEGRRVQDSRRGKFSQLDSQGRFAARRRRIFVGKSRAGSRDRGEIGGRAGDSGDAGGCAAIEDGSDACAWAAHHHLRSFQGRPRRDRRENLGGNRRDAGSSLRSSMDHGRRRAPLLSSFWSKPPISTRW